MGQGLQGMLLDLLGRRVEKRVVLLGLDNAGKTTCVYRLMLGRKVDTVPTIGFNSEEIRHGRCNFIVWDIGGQAKIRKLWRHYVESADALIFVVDAQDRARLREARSAFKRMLRHKTLKNTVLLILANKTDYAGCMTLAEIVEGLDVCKVINDRQWFIQRTCAISGQGLREGLDWLAQALEVQAAGARGQRGALAFFASQQPGGGVGGWARRRASSGGGGGEAGSGRFSLRRGVNGSTNSSLSSTGEGEEEREPDEEEELDEEEQAGAGGGGLGGRRASAGASRARRRSGSGGSLGSASAAGEGMARRRSGSWWQRLLGRDPEADAGRRREAELQIEAFRNYHGDLMLPSLPGEEEPSPLAPLPPAAPVEAAAVPPPPPAEAPPEEAANSSLAKGGVGGGVNGLASHRLRPDEGGGGGCGGGPKGGGLS